MPDIVFITGATSGFGAACARRFARDGARLVLTGRRTDRLEVLAQELDTDVHLAHLDVRDGTEVETVVATLPAAFADVTVLLNNAGLALGIGPMQSVDVTQSETMVDTNIGGVVSCTRAILPGMVARNHGHVVNIGSVAASYPYPGGNVYAGTKAFVHQFSLGLRADSDPHEGARHVHRARSLRNRVLARPVRGRRGESERGLRRDETAQRGGHRRDRPLVRLAAPARERQPRGDHAGPAGVEPVRDRPPRMTRPYFGNTHCTPVGSHVPPASEQISVWLRLVFQSATSSTDPSNSRTTKP